MSTAGSAGGASSLGGLVAALGGAFSHPWPPINAHDFGKIPIIINELSLIRNIFADQSVEGLAGIPGGGSTETRSLTHRRR